MKTPYVTLAWCLTACAAFAAEINFSVEEPSGVARAAWPVTSGVPLAQGVLREPRSVSLQSADGVAVPVQSDALARWPDGSVRWLLLDFQTSLEPRQKKSFTLRTSASGNAAAGSGATLRVAQAGKLTTIETGPLKLELNADAFDPFGAVWLDRSRDGRFSDDERVTQPSGGFFVRDTQGHRFTGAAAPADIIIEESGVQRVCVRITGRHASTDGAMFSYLVRLHAYRGQPYVKCSYTFTNDYQESVMASVEEIGLRARLASAASGAVVDGKARTTGGVFQVDEAHYELDGKPTGAHARGWAAESGANAGFALGVREFWQQWPKAIAAGDGAVTVGLCPDFPEGLYDGKGLIDDTKLYYALRRGVYTFKVGVAKTHEIWANFFAGAASPEALDSFYRAAEEPLLATCQPAYINATRVAGELPPADPKKFGGYDAWFDRNLRDHLQRREREREYGLLNYGDWYGERRVNWGNLEYDLQSGLLLEYLRTGDRRFFDRGAQASRHHIDVDVVHATNPHLKNPWGLPPVVGEIWLHSVSHTGGYFINAPLPVDRTYQMGHSSNYGHVWVSGDLDYYYLTGDRRAREVALSAADTMAAALTRTVGTHIRDIGWPLVLVLSAYDATNDPKYLEAAKRNWESLKKSIDWQRGWIVKLASDHCLHPKGSTTEQRNTIYKDQKCEGNVPFMEGLTLCALARYHRITGDPEVLKALTVGVNQMIRECWLEDLKTFRYTACPLTTPAYDALPLSAEAIAYEAVLTNNAEHRRILREGMKAAIAKSGGGFGKNFGQMTFFAPFALSAMEE